ncbi:SWF or SNF family helicase [Streptomyces zhihengii]|uniref:SWF or SNF family helicase n=1 Tax=Streptomyces zhihengii TaxID=1818004 RepID=A0ABS2UKW7_9ACTN|nr:SWF or SNF family helicase [Streptomyces zhihengii]MBM9617547.1 SWF or SNF family helicase [Streptomyces zhihengii]
MSHGHDEGRAPGTGDDAGRTFDALPPAPGRGFAATWWGRAWLKALEDSALDGAQLKRGRAQARSGAVGAVTVRPGRITAVVRDRDGTAHRGDVLLPVLRDEEWDRFLAVAVERAGHIAALLDHDMPPHLVEDAAAAGVELLPGIGDLEPECSCEAWDLCPHTAALCYQVARLLDQDPFVLLLLRGRGERRLLDDLQSGSAARAAAPAGPQAAEAPDPGPSVRADEAFAARGILPVLPDPPPLPAEAGLPPTLDTETPPAPGVDPDALEFLARDAASRALVLLAGALAPGHGERRAAAALTPDQDAVRMAAAAPPPVVMARLAAGTGRSRTGLELAARAWHHGGAAGLAVLEGDFTPGEALLARATAALESAWDGTGDDAGRPRLRAAGPSRWTVVGARLQLRLGPDGSWWPYRREGAAWAPAGPPSPDPATALASASEPLPPAEPEPAG